MKGAEENRENAGDFTSMNGVSGDLVHELTKRVPKNEEREAEEGEEIDLSLGLSMNGRFGVNPTNKKLRRSSSASNVVVTDTSVGDGSNSQARWEASGSHAPLVKAWSMPSGTPERRHREVFQSARSMEKLKNMGVAIKNENRSKGANGVSDPQVQLVKEATTQNPMMKGLTSRQFLPEPVAADEESLRNSLIDMPYVSTKGFGPNHNKIEGLLYGYKREEEVTIVCVCHGLFLSPAEFVKHGGGGDVAYPLKHIVVSPFPHY